jgi:signal transduction histidine kinase
MNARWYKDWLACLLCLFLVLGLGAVLNLASQVGWAFGGHQTYRSISTNRWSVDGLTPAWWPAFKQTEPLVPGDTLVAINGQPYGATALNLYAQAQTRGDRTVDLTIIREGQRLERRVTITNFTWSQLFDLKLPDLINGLSIWLLALAVYRTQPRTTLNRVFALAAGTMSICSFIGVHSLLSDTNLSTRFITLIWIVCLPWLGAHFTYVALVFPYPLYTALTRRRILGCAYSLSILLVGCMISGHWLWWGAGWSPLVETLDGIGFSGIYLLLFAGLLACCARLLWESRQSQSSPRLRRQLRILLFSVALTTPYIFIMIANNLYHIALSFFLAGLDLRYLVLAIPLGFAFIIIRYQTFRSSDPLLTWALLLISSAALASLFVWLARGLSSDLSALPLFPLVFATTFISNALWGYARFWQNLLRRFLNLEQLNYRAAHSFGQQVIGQTELALLPDLLARTLVEDLEVACAAVWLWDENGLVFKLKGQHGQWIDALPTDIVPQQTLEKTDFFRLQTELACPAWLMPIRQVSAEVVCVLRVGEQQVGLLGLGRRWDEEIFDERDREIIELIAQQAALFLLTARQIEALSQVPRQVTEAQERERRKIARELHDHTEQFLASLSLDLAVSQRLALYQPAQVSATLDRCLADIEEASKVLRRIRINLAPQNLEKGLLTPLNNLVDHFSVRAKALVQFDFPAELDTALPMPARHAIYRVVQQALDNIAAHAAAQNVTITFKRGGDKIEILLSDDGRGFSEMQRVQARAEAHFGLDSMRDRMLEIGGGLTIISAPDRGTRIEGWLPIFASEASHQ